jgi:hypothetical protein
MTLMCGFSHAARNRLVISARDSSKCECTEATQMSNPSRKSAPQSTEPSGPMLSSVPCSSSGSASRGAREVLDDAQVGQHVADRALAGHHGVRRGAGVADLAAQAAGPQG